MVRPDAINLSQNSDVYQENSSQILNVEIEKMYNSSAEE